MPKKEIIGILPARSSLRSPSRASLIASSVNSVQNLNSVSGLNVWMLHDYPRSSVAQKCQDDRHIARHTCKCTAELHSPSSSPSPWTLLLTLEPAHKRRPPLRKRPPARP
eukprot:1223391-Prymnesium_polylepis.1